MARLFTWLAVGCLIWKIAAVALVVREFEKRGVAVNRWLVRVLTCAYAGTLWKVTRAETGRVAPLFYSLVGSTVALLSFFVLALSTRAS
jgi:hypothetical protein